MSPKNKKVPEAETLPLLRIVSLGCAKNFVDTEIAAASLICAGFGLTPCDDEANILFINTCAFLKAARDEAENVIQDAEEWKAEAPDERRIIVSGCVVEWDKDGAFRSAHPQVDAWTGIDAVADLGAVASSVWNGQKMESVSGVSKKYLYDHATPRLQLTSPHYAYIKIADGCDNCCTYCRIPSIRGALRSRSIESVVTEAESLVRNGVRELILIAQDSSAFGREVDGVPKLAHLLRALDGLPGDYFIRLMYLHPASVNEELLTAMAESKHLIRCIEMPLQHISDPILKAMHRHISEEDTRKLIVTLKVKAGLALRTTFMVGFPGETEEDFQKLKDFVRDIEFTRLGVFAYSNEDGVSAASLPEQVPADLAERRRDELMRLQSEISLKANQQLVGRELPVIIDESDGKHTAYGRTLFDAPDIDNSVVLRNAKKCRAGDVVTVCIESASEYELKAVPVSGKKR